MLQLTTDRTARAQLLALKQLIEDDVALLMLKRDKHSPRTDAYKEANGQIHGMNGVVCIIDSMDVVVQEDREDRVRTISTTPTHTIRIEWRSHYQKATNGGPVKWAYVSCSVCGHVGRAPTRIAADMLSGKHVREQMEYLESDEKGIDTV